MGEGQSRRGCSRGKGPGAGVSWARSRTRSESGPGCQEQREPRGRGGGRARGRSCRGAGRKPRGPSSWHRPRKAECDGRSRMLPWRSRLSRTTGSSEELPASRHSSSGHPSCRSPGLRLSRPGEPSSLFPQTPGKPHAHAELRPPRGRGWGVGGVDQMVPRRAQPRICDGQMQRGVPLTMQSV